MCFSTKLLQRYSHLLLSIYFPNLPTTISSHVSLNIERKERKAIRSEFFSTRSDSNCRRLARSWPLPSPFFFLSFFFFAKPIVHTKLLCQPFGSGASFARALLRTCRAHIHVNRMSAVLKSFPSGGNGRYLTHLVADRRER